MKKYIFVVVAAITFAGPSANAAVIFADTIIDYFDSGTGDMAGPYGGTFPGAFPVPVPLTHATDADSTTFVSLPTGSYITFGFSTGFVFDGVGNDIFISEVGSSAEFADIFVSSDFGLTFTYLGVANGGLVTELDLGSIGYAGMVNAVRVVGLDDLGGSQGFDVAFVQGLEGSSIETVPAPAALGLLGFGLAGLGIARRRRSRK